MKSQYDLLRIAKRIYWVLGKRLLCLGFNGITPYTLCSVSIIYISDFKVKFLSLNISDFTKFFQIVYPVLLKYFKQIKKFLKNRGLPP